MDGMRPEQIRKAVETHFSETGQPARIRDIVDRTGISKSSTHRWTVKLWDAGVLSRIPAAHGTIAPRGKS